MTYLNRLAMLYPDGAVTVFAPEMDMPGAIKIAMEACGDIAVDWRKIARVKVEVEEVLFDPSEALLEVQRR